MELWVDALRAVHPDRGDTDLRTDTQGGVTRLSVMRVPSLLHDVFRTLGESGLDVDHARIHTTKGAAIDAFYVTTPEGKKLTDPAALARLQLAMEEATGITAARKAAEQV